MFRYRLAHCGDHAAVARLYRELGTPEDPPSAEVFAGLLPRLWVAERVAEGALPPWRSPAGDAPDPQVNLNQMAEGPEGEIGAFAYYDTYRDIGHIRYLVTSPAWRRQGLGRRLMLQLASEFRAVGLGRWGLNVKPDNGPAIALYNALGLEMRHQVVVLRCPWPAVLALPPSPRCEVGLAGPDEDAELEAAFGLHPGQVASHRALPRRHPLRVRDSAGNLVGYANWVPDQGGAYPFALRELAYAQAMFAEMWRQCSESPPDVFVNTPVGSDVEGLLRSTGAVEVLRVCWMEGPIP